MVAVRPENQSTLEQKRGPVKTQLGVAPPTSLTVECSTVRNALCPMVVASRGHRVEKRVYRLKGVQQILQFQQAGPWVSQAGAHENAARQMSFGETFHSLKS